MKKNLSYAANRSSAIQEISRISWNLDAQYHIHKTPPPVPILNHISPVHDTIPLLEDPL